MPFFIYLNVWISRYGTKRQRDLEPNGFLWTGKFKEVSLYRHDFLTEVLKVLFRGTHIRDSISSHRLENTFVTACRHIGWKTHPWQHVVTQAWKHIRDSMSSHRLKKNIRDSIRHIGWKSSVTTCRHVGWKSSVTTCLHIGWKISVTVSSNRLKLSNFLANRILKYYYM
jgi:hypothetical protein